MLNNFSGNDDIDKIFLLNDVKCSSWVVPHRFRTIQYILDCSEPNFRFCLTLKFVKFQWLTISRAKMHISSIIPRTSHILTVGGLSFNIWSLYLQFQWLHAWLLDVDQCTLTFSHWWSIPHVKLCIVPHFHCFFFIRIPFSSLKVFCEPSKSRKIQSLQADSHESEKRNQFSAWYLNQCFLQGMGNYPSICTGISLKVNFYAVWFQNFHQLSNIIWDHCLWSRCKGEI